MFSVRICTECFDLEWTRKSQNKQFLGAITRRKKCSIEKEILGCQKKNFFYYFIEMDKKIATSMYKKNEKKNWKKNRKKKGETKTLIPTNPN